MLNAERFQRRWWPILIAIALSATVLRIVYVLSVSRHIALGADATWFLLQRGSLFEGLGYVDPETLFGTGRAVATANFPPAYPVFLVLVRLVGGDSPTVAQLSGALTGAVTVVLSALVARRFVGPRASLLAAALVAVSPMLIAADGSLMSESIYVPIVALVVLAALEAQDTGRWWTWVLLGASLGVAALTRSESVLLIPLVLLPVLWWKDRTLSHRFVSLVAAGVLAMAVIAPWVIRNHSALGVATISTVSPATALAGANCARTYSGASIGSWEYSCIHAEDRKRLGEVAWADEIRSDAMSYMGDHLGRLPAVLTARELRVWGLWNPADLVRRDVEETRTAWFQWVVRSTGVLTLVGGVAGLWLLRGRGSQVIILAAPVVMVALTALVSHGNPRFRTVAEPELLIAMTVWLRALWNGPVAGWRA